MRIIGLTGSICMGKSTAATLAKRLGYGVFDADRAAHNLTRPHTGAALPKIAKAFPDCVEDGILNRAKLGKLIFENPAKRKELEHILHPMISKMRDLYLKQQRRLGRKFVLLDIPLLFEQRLDRMCDAVLVVYCSDFLQARRALARPTMTRSKFNHIKQQQLHSHKKRKRAHFTAPSGLGKHPITTTLKRIRGF